MGSSAASLTSGIGSLTVRPGTPLTSSQVDVGPASLGMSGLTRLMADDFSIYNVGYSLGSTWDYAQSYAGAPGATWQDTSTSQRYFFSAATNAAFAASIPGSRRPAQTRTPAA